MHLTRHEEIVLERMALHMVATGDMDLDRAAEAVRSQDREMLTKLIALGDKTENVQVGDYQYEGQNGLVAMRDAMARRVYKSIRARGNACHILAPIGSKRVVKLMGGVGPERSIVYRVDGERDAYVSLEALQLHIRGICKEDCPRCALQALIDDEAKQSGA